MELALAIAGIGSLLCLLFAAALAIAFAILLRRAMHGVGTLAYLLPAPPPAARGKPKRDGETVRTEDALVRVTDPTPAALMPRPPDVVATLRAERDGRAARREETHARLMPLPSATAAGRQDPTATPATQAGDTPRASPRAGRTRTGPVGLEHIAFGSAPRQPNDTAATEVFDTRRRPTVVPPDDDLTDGNIVPEED